MSAITKFLPRNHLSYFIGKLVHWQGPRFLVTPMIQIFAKIYNIDLNEAEKPVSEYPSIGEFFVRRLKPGIRPIAETFAVHPADSEITQNGVINDGKLIQAKGKFYKAHELLADTEATKKYQGGYFITYYLCPTDYHRVHSPVTGLIQKVTHIPGELWPVNKWSVESIHDLFSVNERVVVEMATDYGPVAAVFVGATNVGQIELSFEPSVRGNQLTLSRNRVIEYKTPVDIQRGAELGMFRMGSTVVMLYSEEFTRKFNGSLHLGPYVRMGQGLT